MADTKVTGLSELNETPANDDWVQVIDISDISYSANGTNKKVTKANLIGGLASSTHATTHASGGSDPVKLDDLASPDDNTDLDATTSAHGLLPKLAGGTSTFLRADGTYATPAVGASDSVQITVYNSTGVTLSKGKAVYIDGWKTGDDVPTVALARADSATTMPALGLVIADISNVSTGTVMVVGTIDGLDTSIYSLDDGLYIDATTAGDLTTTKPVANNYIQSVARVTRVNASNGTIFVAGALRSNDIPNFTASDKYWYGGTGGVSTEGTITSAGRAILDDADASAQRTTLGLAIGTDVQGVLAEGAFADGDKTKLDGIEALADVTDATNVTTALSTVGVSAHSDVNTSKSKTPADGDVLTFDGTDWNAEAAAGGGGGQTTYDVIIGSAGDYATLGAYVTAGATAGDRILIQEDTTETANVTIAVQVTIVGNGATLGMGIYQLVFTGTYIDMRGVGVSCTSGRFRWSGDDGVMIGCDLAFSAYNTQSSLALDGKRQRVQGCNINHTASTGTAQIVVHLNDSDQIVSGNNFRIPVAGDANNATIHIQGVRSMFVNNIVEVLNITAYKYLFRLYGADTRCANNTVIGATNLKGGSVTGASAVVADNIFTSSSLSVMFELNGGEAVCKGNLCRSSTSAGKMIEINSNYNIVVANHMIKSGSTGYGIFVDGDFNVISANIVKDASTGIILGGNSDDNIVDGNMLNSCTTPLNDLGTGTVVGDNKV